MKPQATLSADLRRISYWLVNGQEKLAWEFIDRDLVKYSDLGLTDTLLRLKKIDRLHAAELAMTTSIILANRAQI